MIEKEEWDDKSQEPGKEGGVRRWLSELDLAHEVEKQWIMDAKEAINVYRGDKFSNENEKRKETFNILYSNIAVKKPALYNSSPRPDIRRRNRDEDPVGRWVSELLERCVSYVADCSNLHKYMKSAVNDMILPGRGITRVKYDPTMNGDEVAAQDIVFEAWDWDRFRRGGGNKWEDVRWIAFEHHFTKDQFKEKWPEFVDQVNFNVSEAMENDDTQADDKESDSTIFKRTRVWEIWDKDEKEVIFISDSFANDYLQKTPDPLNLIDFWPIPEPLYAIEETTSLTPLCEYTMYETLAKELEKLTNRIRIIIDGIRVRGAYDAEFTELAEIFESADNELIPVANATMYAEKGGLSNAIWMLDSTQTSQILQELYMRRKELIHDIYEITGISDIFRGTTNPYETKGAQEIKASVGSGRLQEQQQSVQRYARDLIRISVEIISDKFSRETMSAMSGLNFPTQEDQQKAQMAAQTMQAQGGQIPPQLQEILKKPSWEQIEEVLKSDFMREYRVDVETDSTIEQELNRDKHDISEIIVSVSKFMQSLFPAVQAQIITHDAMKSMIKSAVRRHKMGREVEDAIDNMPPPPPDNQAQQDAQAEQQRQQTEQMRVQMEAQAKQAGQQLAQAQAQQEVQAQQFEQEMALRESQMEEMKLSSEQQESRHKEAMEAEKLRSEEAIRLQEIRSREQIAMQQEANRRDSDRINSLIELLKVKSAPVGEGQSPQGDQGLENKIESLLGV